MTTPLFMLRAIELGLSVEDIDELDTGLIYDMLIERSNDEYEYPIEATQSDFDKFRGM